MKDRPISPEARELSFNKFIVSEYLKYGSVDEIFVQNHYNLPVSYPQAHRIINSWGVVKSAGPNSLLSEALVFLSLVSAHKLPLETIYKKLPPSFKTSLATMHRIVHYAKEGLIRRSGTALVITPFNNPRMVLVGEDISTPRLDLGKPFGSVSMPMGYSKEKEESEDSILRILQREVLTREVVNQSFPDNIIPKEVSPFMFMDVADVRVGVFNLVLPEKYSQKEQLSSFKLKNLHFVPLESLIDPNGNKNALRQGIREIAIGYHKHLNSDKSFVGKPAFLKSFVNSVFFER